MIFWVSIPEHHRPPCFGRVTGVNVRPVPSSEVESIVFDAAETETLRYRSLTEMLIERSKLEDLDDRFSVCIDPDGVLCVNWARLNRRTSKDI